MLKKMKGQSTLEYITVFVAVVVAIVLLAANILRPSINKVLEASADRINAAAANFQSSPLP